MTDGLRHVVHRRVHLERSQPQGRRARVGRFLEKKRDYKKRAERFHVLERRIRDLADKARFRNEDEFNFKMVHGKLGDDGVVVLPSSSAVATRKLDNNKKFRRSLDQLDRNRFVLQHRSNIKGKRATAAITENATLLMGEGSHVEFSDSSEEEADPSGAVEGSESSSVRATKRVDDHLLGVSEALQSKRADDELRQRLDAERNIRLAVHNKRQVRRVKGTNVHLFPFVRQK
ncbi:putative U3 small nucleolar RNA-associated protein 11 [Babesia sp. Xinjiang]|uniref:putative U3 small nucleolar RNA-associated protein 11 n=1 Tax=Babesia sp. Xinjiang TaxID=462227 RepID=UPI000A23F555|nr:putative U3 small nucleolar RNA-associated protein 11 [Babesia sp. Xinjiang]ORM40498.1 putative U3 small nucleolar RNA-associated protein 11 [Babesia sp. Xinjiang]